VGYLFEIPGPFGDLGGIARGRGAVLRGPPEELARAQAVAREVALVQAVEVAQRHRDHLLEVRGVDERGGEAPHAVLVERLVVADDGADQLGEVARMARIAPITAAAPPSP
jgi:hypothetical protein